MGSAGSCQRVSYLFTGVSFISNTLEEMNFCNSRGLSELSGLSPAYRVNPRKSATVLSNSCCKLELLTSLPENA